MAVFRRVRTWFDDFLGARTFTAGTPEPGTGWTIKDTSAAGAPTYASVTPSQSGEIALTCAADSEAEVLTLYWNNILALDVDVIEKIRFNAKVAGIDSVTTLVMGLATAQSDTSDSVASNAWFRMQGSASLTALLVESDDSVTDLDDKATGLTLAAVYKNFEISFERGKTDVRFYIDGKRVAETFTFTLTTETGGLQPFFQLQKASGTGVPALTIEDFEIVYKQALGA